MQSGDQQHGGTGYQNIGSRSRLAEQRSGGGGEWDRGTGHQVSEELRGQSQVT